LRQGEKVDPITLTTIWHAFRRLCFEMRYVVERTCQSSLISQLHDLTTGVWDKDGETVAFPIGLAPQFALGIFPIRAIRKKYGDDIYPGDVFLTNDPYHGGANTHLPDWRFFRPIFHKDELLFFTMVEAHQMDTGGAFPGGYFPNAYDIHAEGICIPPIKVFAKGVERSDVLELIWNNVRFVEAVRVDNYAMIASTKICEKRIGEILQRYGKETVMACVDEMKNRMERAVRSEIAKIPDGTYYGEAASDDDGTELDVPVWIRCTVTVQGDEMTVDFSQSEDQRKGFVNCVYGPTFAETVVASMLFFDTSLSEYHNEGSFRPIHVISPEGKVTSCRYPATVGGMGVSMGTQIMEAVLAAMSQALPTRAVAAWGRHRGDYTFGTDFRTGEQYVKTSFDYDGSAGAVYGFDGYAGATTIGTLGSVNRGNVEEEEIRVPWRVTKYTFATDFSGAGKWRGGPGIHWEAVNEGSDAGMATGSSDGDVMLGPGALGGHPTPPCRTYIRRGEELIRIKPHRMAQLQTGDVVVKHSSGGAGVGLPEERDPEKVCEDVLNELVSLEAARDVFKVVLDPVTLQVDQEKTGVLRG